MKDDKNFLGLETSSTVNAVNSLPIFWALIDSFLAISSAKSAALMECSEPSIATRIFEILLSLCCCGLSNVYLILYYGINMYGYKSSILMFSHFSMGLRTWATELMAYSYRMIHIYSDLGCVDMVYKYIDIVGTSPNGVDEAVKNAIDEAAKTVKNLKWAELGRTTVRIEEQKIQEYQTEVRIGFRVERDED
jgi:flavin-binding protein dodecin